METPVPHRLTARRHYRPVTATGGVAWRPGAARPADRPKTVRPCYSVFANREY